MLSAKIPLFSKHLLFLPKQHSSKSLNSLFRSLFSSQSNSTLSSKKFTELPLVPQLKELLQQKGLEYLTNIQNLSLPQLLEGKNTLLQSETSTGKTFCYILPILNHILSSQTVNSGKPNLKGAIVLAPTKELCVQIYSFFRMFDPTSSLRLTRLGSLSFFTAIVPFLDKSNSNEDLRDISFQNVVNTVTWENLDILITTPMQLEDILKAKDKKNPYDVNPRFIVLDEYDLMLGEESLAKATRNILRRFAGVHKSLFGDINSERQFILCGSSQAKKVDSITVEEELKNTFKDLQIVQSETFQKVPDNVKYEYITIEKGSPVTDELGILQNLLEKSEASKIVVFCNSPDRIRLVFGWLQENGLKCLHLHSNMPLEERIRMGLQFKFGKDRILVSTDLGSRGIDFKGIDHVIQFDFGLSASMVLHRASITGKFGSNGLVTSFVRDKDEPLASKLKALVDGKEALSLAAASQRSAKKKEKRRFHGEEEDEDEN